MNNLSVQNKEMWAVVKEQAEAVKKAGLLPANMTAEQASIIALKGMELGIGTMRALEGMYVVNGKVGMSANLVMGLIRERCPHAKIVMKRKDAKGCVIEATRAGQEPETFSFTEEDANKAGLIKPGSPWQKYPVNMYWARCVTNMGRQLFSDVLGAPYTPEELGGEVEEAEVNSTRTVGGDLPNQPAIEQSPSGKRVVDLNQRLTGSKPAAKEATQTAPAQDTEKQSGWNEFKEKKANGKAKEAKPLKVNEETGEVSGYPEMPAFDQFQNDEKAGHKHDGFTIKKGIYTGKTLKQLGVQTVAKMLVNTEASIAKRQSKGEDVGEARITFEIIKEWLAENGVTQ